MQNINKNWCRICLGNQDLTDILCSNTILEKIKYCTTVQVSPEDPFPSKICKKCGNYLNIVHAFRMVCEWADMKLQQELWRTNPKNNPQFNKFSYVENAQNSKHPSDTHLIEFLLEREFLESSKVFKSNTDEQTLEDCKNTECNEQDIKYIDDDSSNELEEEVEEEEENNQEMEENDSKQDCSEDSDYYNSEKSLDFIQEDFRNDERTAIIINQHFGFMNEGYSDTEEEGSVVDENMEYNNKEGTAGEEHILDENNTLVDDALIYGCETHQDIYNKSIYGKVCLNTEDPLLHNVSNNVNLLENEEADLTNLKSCFCVQNKPINPSTEKHITLNNISLHDFEHFEKEQINNTLPDNITDKNDVIECNKNKLNKKSIENRVGRHIAKKNAGQPPKRYSPTPEAVKLNTQTQKTLKDDPLTSIKHTQINEEEKLEKKNELKDINNILDQEYILENDLSMPEPIFEETIVTDNFYYENQEEDPLENNTEDHKIDSKTENQLKQNRRKNNVKSCKKLKKKVNIFVDQTVTNSVRPKCNIKKNTKKTNNSETETKPNNSTNDAQQSNSLKRKFLIKKNKKRKGTTCKLCNKSFPFPSHLQRHLTAHIGIKRFICKHCNKEFLHRYNLSVHMRSHTGNFPLECNICNRGFVSSSVLERHKRSHTGETPFQCRYCLQLFSHASSLNMHEKMHLNRPSFPCDICYKVFSYKSSLNAHKKGHSNFKPHSCNVCHKKFTRRTSVLRHMSCHSDVKKVKCQNCGKLFNKQSNLVKHREIHQGLC